MKKIGLISLALVLALGLGGVAYAGWTDSVTIDGTVNTGTVDLVVTKYSGTTVWKIEESPYIEVVTGWLPLDPPTGTPVDAFPNDPPGTPGIDPVSRAIAAPDGEDAIRVDFRNMFPCVDYKVDFLLRYPGSIPARLSITDPVFTGDNATFFNELVWTLPPGDPRIALYPAFFRSHPSGSYLYGEMWTSNAAGEKLANIPDLEGYQLHGGDYILMRFTLHLGQVNELQGMNASFTAAINGVQWNEYP